MYFVPISENSMPCMWMRFLQPRSHAVENYHGGFFLHVLLNDNEDVAHPQHKMRLILEIHIIFQSIVWTRPMIPIWFLTFIVWMSSRQNYICLRALGLRLDFIGWMLAWVQLIIFRMGTGKMCPYPSKIDVLLFPMMTCTGDWKQNLITVDTY